MAEEKKNEAVELNEKQQKVLDLVSEMTVLELADLVKAMEEKFGVSAAAPVAAVAAAPAAGGAAEAEEKSAYDVVIEGVDNKIGVIKAVKEILGVGLTEAKEFVESVPKAVKEGVTKEEAEELKKKLEEAGAKVTLK